MFVRKAVVVTLSRLSFKWKSSDCPLSECCTTSPSTQGTTGVRGPAPAKWSGQLSHADPSSRKRSLINRNRSILTPSSKACYRLSLNLQGDLWACQWKPAPMTPRPHATSCEWQHFPSDTHTPLLWHEHTNTHTRASSHAQADGSKHNHTESGKLPSFTAPDTTLPHFKCPPVYFTYVLMFLKGKFFFSFKLVDLIVINHCSTWACSACRFIPPLVLSHG